MMLSLRFVKMQKIKKVKMKLDDYKKSLISI